MGTCPVCNHQVPDDFGLISCDGCGAQLLVHVDGRVEHTSNQEDTPSLEASEPPSDFEPQAVFPPAQDMEFATEAEEPVPDIGAPEPEEHLPAELVEPEVLEEPPQQMFDGSEPEQSGAAEVYKPVNPPNSPDLSDLAGFANSQESGGREGPLRYNLSIAGIDTSDIREAFREAITDRKFMWDTEQIVRSIRNGEVRIANVSPVKAFILINRLRNLPLQVEWEQHAITQP